jgi:itaconyl-CoA hydratase
MNKIKKYKKIGENIFLETFGISYFDIQVDATVKHWPGRTITESDNMLMSMLSGNNHPIHCDYEFSKNTEWKKPIVSSLVTTAIVGGMSLKSTSAQGLMNLGWENIKLPNPVFIGDTIYAESTYLSKRPSASRPGEGIVTVETRGHNQNGEVVISWIRSFLMRIDEK